MNPESCGLGLPMAADNLALHVNEQQVGSCDLVPQQAEGVHQESVLVAWYFCLQMYELAVLDCDVLLKGL